MRIDLLFRILLDLRRDKDQAELNRRHIGDNAKRWWQEHLWAFTLFCSHHIIAWHHTKRIVYTRHRMLHALTKCGSLPG